MDAFLEVIQPQWLKKLPVYIQYFIVGFVGLHLLALVVVALMYCTSKKTPDFKSKIK
jgi:hypothetical protein